MNKLIIYGASGHGKVIADIARLNGYKDIVFCDDDLSKNEFDGYAVIHELPQEEYDLVIGIGDNKTRQKIAQRVNHPLVTLIHPEAVIAKDSEIGEGTVVMAKAVINSGTKVGKGVIVNTYSSLDHDNIIHDYVHISVNAHTAGTVEIKERCFIGMGSNIINNINICEDVTIGAGSTVVKDIDEPGTYIGSPARKKI